MRTIGVLTSGGDAPGMNAAIRAVVRQAAALKIDVIGISRGYAGLIQGDFRRLNTGSVAGIIHRGGTILLTARSEEFRTEAGRATALDNLHREGIEGLVVIGGDGSFHGAVHLAKKGLPVIGIPGTIDNDIAGTDYTIGFDTAVNTAVEAISRIRDTATSHERIFIIEVMGRRSGQIALAAGIAGGAESILIPEYPVNYDRVVEKLEQGRHRGKLHSIIVVAEGVGSALEVSEEIARRTRLESRVTILGHIQRGGAPTAFDCMLASRLGARAVDLLADGASSRMVGIAANELVDRDLETVLREKKSIDPELYRLAEVLAL
ncbi:ATP-dependent 6-phosphofructokinase [Moorella thermoacetica]|uniref:ATP-dependent 6-phosphofructokinase n=1 Tax=Moorella thermoacetica (strain ATCC 39073 / JCM 9320) TaxID=264732 RepID=Q2RHC1_MOOTA|nr:6-phosphofructokinase [Moorella thermoacetica]AKX94684.1 6-phosphofructokinase [Moorella thermoacetica]AKX97317.1 6-phosphofructokinase [Moorella thermoacetica]OIQ57264.1 6-phosphofructokinase [Moorella thermoacetica]QDA01145.1 6-phosphofructokinase [Moorella thermoacetica]TYL10304.1 ATP-dependent 6-phosphofructokinase [Moorella thermoacetica]